MRSDTLTKEEKDKFYWALEQVAEIQSFWLCVNRGKAPIERYLNTFDYQWFDYKSIYIVIRHRDFSEQLNDIDKISNSIIISENLFDCVDFRHPVGIDKEYLQSLAVTPRFDIQFMIPKESPIAELYKYSDDFKNKINDVMGYFGQEIAPIQKTKFPLCTPLDWCGKGTEAYEIRSQTEVVITVQDIKELPYRVDNTDNWPLVQDMAFKMVDGIIDAYHTEINGPLWGRALLDEVLKPCEISNDVIEPIETITDNMVSRYSENGNVLQVLKNYYYLKSDMPYILRELVKFGEYQFGDDFMPYSHTLQLDTEANFLRIKGDDDSFSGSLFKFEFWKADDGSFNADTTSPDNYLSLTERGMRNNGQSATLDNVVVSSAADSKATISVDPRQLHFVLGSAFQYQDFLFKIKQMLQYLETQGGYRQDPPMFEYCDARFHLISVATGFDPWSTIEVDLCMYHGNTRYELQVRETRDYIQSL